MNYLSGAFLDEVYLAGERVPPGRYQEIDTKREVLLDKDGYLPASLDGRVAAYICIEHIWDHVANARRQPLANRLACRTEANDHDRRTERESN